MDITGIQYLVKEEIAV